MIGQLKYLQRKFGVSTKIDAGRRRNGSWLGHSFDVQVAWRAGHRFSQTGTVLSWSFPPAAPYLHCTVPGTPPFSHMRFNHEFTVFRPYRTPSVVMRAPLSLQFSDPAYCSYYCWDPMPGVSNVSFFLHIIRCSLLYCHSSRK
jgi:hypothetical protein